MRRRELSNLKRWICLGGDNQIAIDLIVRHVNRELQKRGVKVRNELFDRFEVMQELSMPQTFFLVEQTAQIIYLMTIIRY